MIELVALDIAGTTIDEGGAVYRVLADSVRAAGADPTPQEIETWMGASKREAIQAMLAAAGADASAPVVDRAFADFRERLAAAYRAQPPAAFRGVPEALAALRSAGVRVALTTGFDRAVTTALLDTVGWGPDVLDGVVCIDDVPAGRPAPYMIFRAMELTGVADVRRVVVAGDTTRDVAAGLNAGAAAVVAVRTGEVPASTLAASGATHLLDSVADLPSLVTRLS